MQCCGVERRLVRGDDAGKAAGGHHVEGLMSQQANCSESMFPDGGSGLQQAADRDGAQEQVAALLRRQRVRFDPRRRGREGGTRHKRLLGGRPCETSN